ncbi:LysR family transcriptional regulator [Actinomadura sp. NBRC 104412]|uniref:SDR family oxidoreductase n=1 Tax=Actinomadura sp. NBRC 104412 TaxID=3032203 RepID=UPI0024A5D424|nr:SDR family oxidoreductase [Actinomadura sp. NBRC 104412]GLZ02670.1 LysR family transcriptional regulator [Actinomadura sp. NBRC 104412]
MKIVIIGGSGLIGSKLVDRLAERGHEAVPASPSTGVDTLTGRGLPEVMDGASVVVDVSNAPSFEAAAVMEFFRTSTRNLLEAEEAAGVGHHVALSVVGTGRRPDNDYFRAKKAQEQLIEDGPIPYSIVHATQFFEFTGSIADVASQDGTVRIPPVQYQPIAAADVAQRLAEVAVGPPLNGRIEIAGPERFRMDEFFRHALADRNDRREVVADPHAPYFGSEVGERDLVPVEGALTGSIRYDDWPGRTGTGG